MTKARKHKTKGRNTEQPQAAGVDQDRPESQEVRESPAEQLQAQRDDLLARLQRTAADYLNYQKRVGREIAEAREFANAKLIEQLLPVLDDMERAMEAGRKNHGQNDPLFEGMQLVHDKALETLAQFGVSVIDAAGHPFDPDKHSAVMQQPSDDHPAQTVLQEVRKGYEMKGRTLRPAAVIVSKEPAGDDQDGDSEGTAVWHGA